MPHDVTEYMYMVNIVSGNGLALNGHQAITCTIEDLSLFTEPKGTISQCKFIWNLYVYIQ